MNRLIHRDSCESKIEALASRQVRRRRATESAATEGRCQSRAGHPRIAGDPDLDRIVFRRGRATRRHSAIQLDVLKESIELEAYPVVPGSSIFSGWPISAA
jgi:hypothetical protein